MLWCKSSLRVAAPSSSLPSPPNQAKEDRKIIILIGRIPLLSTRTSVKVRRKFSSISAITYGFSSSTIHTWIVSWVSSLWLTYWAKKTVEVSRWNSAVCTIWAVGSCRHAKHISYERCLRPKDRSRAISLRCKLRLMISSWLSLANQKCLTTTISHSSPSSSSASSTSWMRA